MEPEGESTRASESPRVFPPGLGPVLFRLLPGHPVLESLGRAALAEVLTRVFFASLQTEEGIHHPIRVALTGGPAAEAMLTGITSGWTPLLRLRAPCACTTRNLLRLSRAAPSDRLFITVARTANDSISITGLVREGFGSDAGAVVKLRVVEPGNIEVWAGGRCILEYEQGQVLSPPEDLLLASGLVRAKLLSFAAEARAPTGYIESIASIIRNLADHPHGGILILNAKWDPSLPGDATFAVHADTHVWELLHRLESTELDCSDQKDGHPELLRSVLRTELAGTLGEVGNLTALDGATILDRRLGVHGFGVVLPVNADVEVVEVTDAAATVRRPFAIEQYGARHRAAASYAARHPGSLVFIASATGTLGCMLREAVSSPVLLWRFRSGDLGSRLP